MTDSRKPFKKKMCVTHQRVIATWPNSKGTADTHLYEITAVDENGEEINEKLRSFAEVELNILIEYDLEPYSHPQHGDSWTVKKPRSNTTQRVAHLEKELADVKDRLAAMENAVAKIAPTQERTF